MNLSYLSKKLSVLAVLVCLSISSTMFSFNSYASMVDYELSITRGEFASSGSLFKNKILVNGSIPAPELTFSNGDTARITVHNKLEHPTLIHWHGLLIKNDQDGVPFVNSMPIKPKSTKVYEFKIRQTGTYWYHSHVMFQEQDGVYGAFRILPRKKNITRSIPEKTVVLSDISHESGRTIHRNLKKDGEYYDIKKDTVQSWFKAFKTGTAGVKFRNSLQRMAGMDYADVAYDIFAANGQRTIDIFSDLKTSQKIKIRIINGSASSIYKLTFAGEMMTVVSADGLPVKPVSVKVLPISVAETYDILIDLDSAQKLELRATSFDNSGYASIWLGAGKNRVKAPDMSHTNPIGVTMGEMMGMPKTSFLKEFLMTYKNEFKDIPKDLKYNFSKEYSLPSMKTLMPMMNNKQQGPMTEKNMDQESMHHVKRMTSNNSFRIMNQTKKAIEENKIDKNLYHELTYGLLKTEDPIDIDKKRKLRTIPFTLNGNMENYVWSINGRPLGPKTYIKINKGERVRFEMKNTTMMNHPMHLHGHFFRVMTDQGEHSALKHTVNVSPLSTVVIEFEANEEKDWFFHCHILYHMMDGMTRIVRYEDNPGSDELELARVKSKEFNFTDTFFLSNKLLAQSNYSRLEGKYFNSYYMFEYDIIGNYDEDLEGEIHLSRTLTRFMSLYIGGKTEGSQGKYETTPTVGLTWVLPLRLSIDVKYQPTLDKKLEIEFANEIQLTDKLQFNFEYSSIRKFYTELEYRQSKHLSFAINYNETYDTWGGGLGYTY